MKIVVVIRSVTLRTARAFVQENLGGATSYFANGKIIATGLGCTYGIKNSRKTDTYRKAKLHFVVADAASSSVTYVRLKFAQSKNDRAELVTVLPYDELLQVVEHVNAFRREHRKTYEYHREWQAVFSDKIRELIPSIKLCDEDNNTLHRRRNCSVPDFSDAA